jgi:hypothetical protein
MAIATTSAIWRSTGGDTTRTAGAGSMKMSLPFYVANVGSTTANVVVSSALSNSAVILPAGSIVTGVVISVANGTGNIDMGFTPLIGVGPGQTTTLGTNVPTGFLSAKPTNARSGTTTAGTNAGASIGNVANATNLVVVTSAANGSASGNISGFIEYFVADSGEENV